MSQDSREEVVVKPAPAMGNMLGIWKVVSMEGLRGTVGDFGQDNVRRGHEVAYFRGRLLLASGSRLHNSLPALQSAEEDPHQYHLLVLGRLLQSSTLVAIHTTHPPPNIGSPLLRMPQSLPVICLN